MNNYSIVRIGQDYVVQANERSVLKFASRRRAARLVTDATQLLDLHLAPSVAPAQDRVSSITHDDAVALSSEMDVD